MICSQKPVRFVPLNPIPMRRRYEKILTIDWPSGAQFGAHVLFSRNNTPILCDAFGHPIITGEHCLLCGASGSNKFIVQGLILFGYCHGSLISWIMIGQLIPVLRRNL